MDGIPERNTLFTGHAFPVRAELCRGKRAGPGAGTWPGPLLAGPGDSVCAGGGDRVGRWGRGPSSQVAAGSVFEDGVSQRREASSGRAG